MIYVPHFVARDFQGSGVADPIRIWMERKEKNSTLNLFVSIGH
jgi:hypothetical protein